jgi:hypothetical protein
VAACKGGVVSFPGMTWGGMVGSGFEDWTRRGS